jgi:REP element-mobilizing transposase RayT
MTLGREIELLKNVLTEGDTKNHIRKTMIIKERKKEANTKIQDQGPDHLHLLHADHQK